MKIEKLILTPKYNVIKEMFKQGDNGSREYGDNFEIDGDLDKLCYEFLEHMMDYSHELGFDAEVEGVKLDLWKERIWTIIEKAGLLPPIAWRSDKDKEYFTDGWYDIDTEFDVDIEKEVEKNLK